MTEISLFALINEFNVKWRYRMKYFLNERRYFCTCTQSKALQNSLRHSFSLSCFEQLRKAVQVKKRHIFLANLKRILKHFLGPVYTVRTKLQKFLRSYVEGVYTIQNGAYKHNGLTAYSVGGHDIVLNWMTEITDLLQFFVVLVKFGSDYGSREVVLSF